MEKSLKIKSVNISSGKGTIKLPVEKIELTNHGIAGDAHSGEWHRQISLLSEESVMEFSAITGREYAYGEFAENITLSGMKMNECRPGDILENSEVKLLVTQIGKKCHGTGCSIYTETGACIMPKEGIFAKVLREGVLKAGESLTYKPKVWNIGVITLSNRASAGIYEDRSGPHIIATLEKFAAGINRSINFSYHLIPDSEENLKATVNELLNKKFDIVFTTGGTGIGPQDITPDVIKGIIEKEIPGIMEFIRVKYGAHKPNALLSRGVAGIAGDTFVFTLPGSLAAVSEYLAEISPMLEHLIYMRMGLDTH
jgi:molybdenum cofactor synthesis domain-containing protein